MNATDPAPSERMALAATCATVTGFARSGDPQAYEGQLNGIALRPGEPGLDFQGPSLFTLTINLAAQDRTVTDVNVVLDAVSFDRQ